MNKKNTNIDKYFQKARNQEVNFSKDDARNLIENNSKIIYKKPFSKFYGVKKMTTISAAIASAVLFAVLTFNSINMFESEIQTDSKIENTHINKNKAVSDYIESEIADNSINEPINDESENNELITENTKYEKQGSTSQTSGSIFDDKPLETNGINLIKLNKEEFAKLGIKIMNDDEFEFLIPSELMNIKYKININKGIEFEEVYDTTFSANKAPTFISRDNGEKIFGRFTSDDNSMQMVYSKHYQYDSNEIRHDFDMNITQMINENVNSNIHNASMDSIKLIKKIEVIVDNNGNKQTSSPNVISKMIKEEMRDSLLNPENSEILIRKVFERIDADSTLKEMAYNNNGFNFDIDVIEDTLAETIVFENFGKLNDNIRVNKLLPLAYVSGNDVKYIFWFDPDIELIKKLPEEYYEELISQYELIENNNYCEQVKAGEETYFDILRSCSGTLKNLSAYPNPTDAALNMEFVLEEAHDITISLHEVSGEKVKEMIINKHYKPGNIQEIFDISDLPAGMYAIIVTSDNGDQVLQRIIKR